MDEVLTLHRHPRPVRRKAPNAERGSSAICAQQSCAPFPDRRRLSPALQGRGGDRLEKQEQKYG